MNSEESLTRSARYFMQHYRATTLLGAVEGAAFAEVDLGLLEGYCTIPVDVERIATRRNIRIQEGLIGPGCMQGRLVPQKGGFVVQIKAESNELRRRNTLAHEVGHTLFYYDYGDKPRHQIGILDRKEILAEEKICDLFARALLMPAPRLREAVSSGQRGSVSGFLDRLEKIAREFQVIIPGLILRLGDLHPQAPPYLVLHFKFKENRKTGYDPRLRVNACATTAGARNLYIWNNRSAEGLNLRSVVNLFNTWRSETATQSGSEGGKYAWRPDSGLLRIDDSIDIGCEEVVEVSILRHGQWKLEYIPMKVASWLYSTSKGSARDAQVISVLSPITTSFRA